MYKSKRAKRNDDVKAALGVFLIGVAVLALGAIVLLAK